ncbi:MAG TPA: hypothetical protein VHX65_03015 [Pirellulales bacterium]|jgi:hypothetical protein|nr:hypothetical protein [Pirellulales bacterium]
MADDINPYRSPAIANSASVTTLVPLRRIWVFFVGAILGCLSFIVAIAFVPSDLASPAQHDLLLANYLGFVFPPLVGLWSGMVRRSWWWSGTGFTIGLAIGAAYRVLCGNDFLAVMVAFPCLLGGAASVALGTGARSSFDGILVRLGKGLLAGLELGFVYMVVLNVMGIAWIPIDSTAEYHRMMWQNGPVAMSIASGFYLVLFVWASNLKRVVIAKPEERHHAP